MVFSYVMMIILMFLSVGFFMYVERKVLGLSQLREGPNKILYKGNTQFLMDLMKLMKKFWVNLIYLNSLFLYLFIPLLLFVNMLIMWFLFPLMFKFVNVKYSMIYLIILLTIKMLIFMVMIYFIYSIYSIISVVRMIIQVISYDIIIILILVVLFMIHMNLSLISYKNLLLFNMKFMMSIILYIFWLISIMVELIRLPFDFYEGESELISGFNIEFSSLLFMLLVLVEYMEMVYFMMLTLYLFFFNNLVSLMFYMILIIFIFMLIWMRVFFVRYRLDKMMLLLWKFMFPLTMMNIMIIYYINIF